MARTAFTTSVMRVVLQRSFGGYGLLTNGADPHVGDADSPLTGGQRVPPSVVGNADRAPRTLVALVGLAADARAGQGADDAMRAGRLDVVDADEDL